MKKLIGTVLKKATVTVMISSLIVYSSGMISFADNNVNEYDMTDVLINEIKEDTGILEEDVEKELNEDGVMDCDIENFDENTIDKINTGKSRVEVSYYYVNDSNENGVVTQNDIYKLSDDQVDELVNEIYKSGEIEKFQSGEVVELNGNTDSNDKMSDGAMGLCINAFAGSDTDTHLSKSGYLRQTITVTDAGKDYYGNPVCAVAYTSTWVKMPKNTKTDVIYLRTDGATTRDYTAKYIVSYVVNGTKLTGEDIKDLKNDVKRDTDCMGVDVDLYDDGNGVTYTKHQIYLTENVIVNNPRKGGFIQAYGKYYHQETKKAIKPSWSISKGGIGVGFSYDHMSKMHEIGPQAALIFNYK